MKVEKENNIMTSLKYELQSSKKENLEHIFKQQNDTINFISGLNTNLQNPVLIPISENLAFLPGKIIHTNECKVYLGEDYFVKTTNHKAIKILENRKSRVEKLLEDVNKEPIAPGVLGINYSKKTEEDQKLVTLDKLSKELPNVSQNASLNKLHDDTIEIVEQIDDNTLPNKPLVSSDSQNDKSIIQDKLKKLMECKEKAKEESVLESLERKKRPTKSENTSTSESIKRSLFFDKEEEES